MEVTDREVSITEGQKVRALQVNLTSLTLIGALVFRVLVDVPTSYAGWHWFQSHSEWCSIRSIVIQIRIRFREVSFNRLATKCCAGKPHLSDLKAHTSLMLKAEAFRVLVSVPASYAGWYGSHLEPWMFSKLTATILDCCGRFPEHCNDPMGVFQHVAMPL